MPFGTSNLENPELNSIIARMIQRRIISDVESRLRTMPAVVLLGPRQVGKTTLAKQIQATAAAATYVDLETSPNRDLLRDNPQTYLRAHADELVILDEVQRVPGLFQELRGVIDRGRQGEGRANGRFLLLGSASRELLAQSGESLAGRIAYRELTPLGITEIPRDGLDSLWLRGGFPESYLAPDDEVSIEWRDALIATYLERDIPQLGIQIPSETLRRAWTMLAHSQGGVLNVARFAGSLGVDGKTVGRYIDILTDLMLVRRLQPHLANVGKRLTRSPKVYVRDSGLLHALLGIPDVESLLRHPILGASWEGFVLENLIAIAPNRAVPGFYRTAGGAEIDLVLEWPNERWAIEVKRGDSPTPTRGFYSAIKDLDPARAFVVYPGAERFPITDNVEAIGLPDLCDELIAQAR